MPAATPDLYALRPGERLVACGTTGSGKSTLAKRYLERSPYHWIIFNPKGTRAFDRLPGTHTLDNKITIVNVEAAIKKYKYVNLKFSSGWTWEYQDALLRNICEKFTNIGVLIDELYYIHASNGFAGSGLVGLLSRGRELHQTFIGLTQRPRFVSKFIFSESDYLIEFFLKLPEDRKTLFQQTGEDIALVKQAGHNFLFFDLVRDRVIAYRN